MRAPLLHSTLTRADVGSCRAVSVRSVSSTELAVTVETPAHHAPDIQHSACVEVSCGYGDGGYTYLKKTSSVIENANRDQGQKLQHVEHI